MPTAKPSILIALAAGDMLGAPMEFMTPERVRDVYGVITGPVAVSHGMFKAGEFTDDTQMTLCLLSAYPADEELIERARSAFLEWRSTDPRDIDHWQAWPDDVIGPACVQRLELACLRAAG